jgi:hypothetical protein
LNGTVLDADKGVLPGATVTVVDENTGLERTTTTEGDGRFVLTTLTPGTYTVTVELPGFQSTKRTGLVLNVGQELTLNLTLELAGVQETLTVTGEAPLVEATVSRIGTNITNNEIDSLPAQGRSQLSLMQTVPGLVPSLAPGSFEGGQFNANGQATNANVFLVDGAYNNDDRRGGSQGTQANVALDAMAEYQVLTHQYTAESGGTGVVVNAVTRSGSNRLSGRVFEYFRDNKLDGTDYFLKQDGEENPDYGSNVFGGNVGGPIIRNRAFYFFNIERTLRNDAANIRFPANAAPLATNYQDTVDFTVMNTFLRGDVQATDNHHFSIRWVRAHELTEKDNLAGSMQTPKNWRYENDAGDHVFSMALTSVLGSRATNELKYGHVRESLLQGPRSLFDDDWAFIGLEGREQFDVGSQNTHPDFLDGNATTFNSDLIRSHAVDDSFTFIPSGWGGNHTFKFGGGFSQNGAFPHQIGANAIGTFSFPTNTAFDPANPRTYPWQFTIRVLGQLEYEQDDWRYNLYAQDKWQINNRLTLNLGLRYDNQDIVPDTKDAIAPRLGVAYDPTGSGKTVIRAGAGKYFNLQSIAVIETLQTDAVISAVNQFNTGQVASPADSGAIPSNVCLQPISVGDGLALISPACRQMLLGVRDQVAAGAFFNRDPTLDGDRRIPYLWAFSAGVERQLGTYVAVSADYIGNRGYDNSNVIDINVGPTNPANGQVTRPGVDVFDPNHELIPEQARGTPFRQVHQYQTIDAFNSDYDAMELSIEKRHANRWSTRLSYTLARAHDVPATVSDSLNPRMDYGRANSDNRHAFAASGNVDIWKGLSGGMVFRAYSGNPINETIGSDVNNDLNNNDRPVAGVHDTTRPILSPLDASGRAIRNGIDGEKVVLLDGRLQYIYRLRERYQMGFFWEIYNLTNQTNFGNPTGDRTSTNFMVPTTVGDARSMQLGVRLTF